MKVTLEVDALETCKPDCPKLEIMEKDSLYMNGRLVRFYECANYDLCAELQRNLKAQEAEG